jgi:hypothetical protein
MCYNAEYKYITHIEVKTYIRGISEKSPRRIFARKKEKQRRYKENSVIYTIVPHILQLELFGRQNKEHFIEICSIYGRVE